MHRMSRPLVRELLLLLLASAAPAAACAAALAASLYDPDWPNGLLLVMSATALAAGIYVSCMIAQGFANALEDLAADARMLGRGVPLARLETKVRELADIADALAAASARLRPMAPPRLDLAQGAQSWSRAVEARYRTNASLAPRAPERPDGWCDPGEVLTRLAQGFASGAAAAGVTLDFDVAPSLRDVRGSAQDLETALFGLLDATLAVTSRGGRIMLSAHEAAPGTVKITLRAARPATAGARGIESAGDMVELNCGVVLAASLARARARVEDVGGALVADAGTVTMLLVSSLAGKRAA
jgi:signal transduction histidine kinase